MWKRIIGYAGAVICTAYLFFMYDAAVLSGIVVMELLYPFCAVLYFLYMRRKIEAQIGYVPEIGEKEKPIKVRFRVINKSVLWSIRFRMRVSVKHNFQDKYAIRKAGRKLQGTVDAGAGKSVDCTWDAKYCGNVVFCLEWIEIYDFLGIFIQRIKVGQSRQTGILPVVGLLPVEITRRTREYLADADEYADSKSGFDSGEIYQVREYRDRDSVRDIHWKLSAKEDLLMVKEHGFPMGCAVLIWLDAPYAGWTGKGFTKMLEQTAALVMTLTEEKCIHMAAWYEEKNERVVKRRIDSEEAVYELLMRLLYLEPYRDKQKKEVYYEEAFKGQAFSSVAVIDGQGDIKVNGEKQQLLQI